MDKRHCGKLENREIRIHNKSELFYNSPTKIR